MEERGTVLTCEVVVAGLVLMMTSADGPNSTLGHLRRRTGQASSVQRGTFTLSGDAVSAVFRQQRKPPAADGGAGRYRRGRRQAHHVESTTVVEQVFELVSPRPSATADSHRIDFVLSVARNKKH